MTDEQIEEVRKAMVIIVDIMIDTGHMSIASEIVDDNDSGFNSIVEIKLKPLPSKQMTVN